MNAQSKTRYKLRDTQYIQQANHTDTKYTNLPSNPSLALFNQWYVYLLFCFLKNIIKNNMLDEYNRSLPTYRHHPHSFLVQPINKKKKILNITCIYLFLLTLVKLLFNLRAHAGDMTLGCDMHRRFSSRSPAATDKHAAPCPPIVPCGPIIWAPIKTCMHVLLQVLLCECGVVCGYDVFGHLFLQYSLCACDLWTVYD